MRRVPLVRKEQERLGQLNAAHFQGAVMEVVLQHGRHVVVEITEGFHQPRDSRVTGGVFKLRACHHRIIGNIVNARELANNLQHSLTRCAEAALQHIADHQRPGIDKGISRFTLFNLELKQRVKRLAGRIFTDTLPDLFFFILAHRRNQTQHFRNGLNGKTLSRIACLVSLSVDGTDSNPQLIPAHRGKGRNIVGNLPLSN